MVNLWYFAQALPPAATATESGLDCKTIIYALAAVVMAMAAFIVQQFIARINDLKDTRELAETLERVVDNQKGGRT